MTTHTITAGAYDELFLHDTPMLDVRAPIEFAKGAFPSSINLPLMQDAERQKVGTCYKQEGQQAAMSLGHQLVSGKIKDARIEAWEAFFQQHPNGYLYCFRGGLRSRISQQWLKESGCDRPYIEGGYKAMRQHLIELIQAPRPTPTYLLSGMTGSGKTDYLQLRPEMIDLEAIANHRGSSFGKAVTPQPSQINFENQLAVALLKHDNKRHSCLLLEDESFLIGRCAIPKPFYQQMQLSPILILEESDTNRTGRLLDAYVTNMHFAFTDHYGAEHGFELYSQYLRKSLLAIKKRLGGKLHDELQQVLDDALSLQYHQQETSAHLQWISSLLKHYYDPMYRFQLDKHQDRMVFRGCQQEISQWLDKLPNQTK